MIGSFDDRFEIGGWRLDPSEVFFHLPRKSDRAGTAKLTRRRTSGKHDQSSETPASDDLGDGDVHGGTMSGDALSDVLRAVRLRGALFYYIEGAAPWVAETPPAAELIPAIMPGVEHMIEFHGIVGGSCWATLIGDRPRRLVDGDVILFPQGDPHVLSSAPGMRAGKVDKALYFTPKPPQLPYSLGFTSEGVTTARLDGGGDERVTIVCGFLGFDARPFNPLIAALPRVLSVSSGTLGADSMVRLFLQAAVAESNQKRPGGEAVLESMSKAMFVDVLRCYVDALPAEQTGWLAGMRDPGVGRALALMHQQPAAPWTLEQLAEATAMSRSVLHERFVHFVGQPPMQYLTQWRMQVAAGLLRDTRAKLVEVALEVGYESDAAFSRAFKRLVGSSPGTWRKQSTTAQTARQPVNPLARDEPKRGSREGTPRHSGDG
jgi:AraC-like DNA-binding protein